MDRDTVKMLGQIALSVLLIALLVWGLDRAHLADLKRQAEGGDPMAQFTLATAYQTGDGVPVNKDEAVKWLRAASDLDFIPAIHELARLYKSGDGVPRSISEYLRLHERAANLLNSESRTIVGRAFLTGNGVDRNLPLAFKLITQAADDRYAPAASLLGQMYFEANGAPCDRDNSEKWLSFAAQQGDEEAQLWLQAVKRGEGCWAGDKE